MTVAKSPASEGESRDPQFPTPADGPSGLEPRLAGAIVVVCKQCGLELTHPLARLPDGTEFVSEDGQPMLPEGSWAMWNDDDDGIWTPGIIDAGAVIANLADVINVDWHPDGRRLQGCCGADGLNGINRVCMNGHEVGTERSDCWMSHGIFFERGRFELMPA